MFELLGSKVKIRFEGTLDDGTVFDSSNHRCNSDVFEFVVGSSTMLPAFNLAVSEMQHIGEKVTIRIPAQEAYGLYNESLIEAVPREAIPNAQQLALGSCLRIETAAGSIRAKVVKLSADAISLDYNHELAGQNLTYTIELLGFQDALEREHDPAGCACGCDKVKKALLGEEDHGHAHQHST